MIKKRAIVSVTNDLFTDQRVDKVCNFLVDQGLSVTLIGRKRNNSMPLETRRYETKRMRLIFHKGALFYANYTLSLFCRLFFSKVDILVSNDLDTLLANHMALKFKRKCELVYDTHEYFTEVPELQNRPFVKSIWERIEGRIFPKLKHVYTVNTSIATQYATKYNKNIKVVRNVAKHWIPQNLKTKKELGIPEDKFILIAQGAGINIDRGIEELVEAMLQLPECCLLIVGDGDVVGQLKAQVNQAKQNNVLFFEKRPYLEMMNFTYHSDLGFSLDKDTNLNYRFSLPNKIFDYIQANTPVFVSDLPEIKKVVLTHSVGYISSSHLPNDLAEAIEAIRLNPAQLMLWKSNCVTAANIECWEHEIETLRLIYSPLI